VLVTGASGYVALHCVQQLLAAGFTVRGTVRDKSNRKKDWPSPSTILIRAMDGCSFVLHVASPWPIVADESTVQTAVEGTMNVLRTAATTSSVKKVVITSSCVAVNDGHRSDSKVFDERWWTNLDNPRVENYARSKTMSELAAWKYWNTLDHNNRFALTVLNPTFIVGPLLSNVRHGSAIIVGRFMDYRTYLATPKVSVGIV
uniref:Epimerase domain-containing protein n=1 Tax=Angiostrongylus cantonensis TaxID=6313 RepID=A0A0K0DQE8_ANGCA